MLDPEAPVSLLTGLQLLLVGWGQLLLVGWGQLFYGTLYFADTFQLLPAVYAQILRNISSELRPYIALRQVFEKLVELVF